MLNNATHDLGTAILTILAGLVGVAFITPGHLKPPSNSPSGRHGATPTPTPSPAPNFELAVFNNNAPRYAWSLARALDAWNNSGASIHFFTISTRSANVTVTMAEPSPCGSDPDVAACTELGHSGRRTISIAQRLDRYAEAQVLVHELGHVIGLTHDTSGGCAAMTPILWQNCELPRPGMWRCRLLEPSDIERAVALVGGTAHPISEPVFCPKGHAP